MLAWFVVKLILVSGVVWLPRKSEWVTNGTGSQGRWQSHFHSALKQGTWLTKCEAYTSQPRQGALCGSSLWFHRRNSWRSWHCLPQRRQQANPTKWVRRAAPWGSAEEDIRKARTGRQMCLSQCEDGLGSRYMCAEMSFPVVQVDSHVLGGLQVETKKLLTTKAPAECSPNVCGIGETSPSYYFLTFKAYSLFHLGSACPNPAQYPRKCLWCE